jgi:hypothetical protein
MAASPWRSPRTRSPRASCCRPPAWSRGDTVQALTWATGAPAVSPDGEHLAVVVRSRDRPARVVVWRDGARAGGHARRAAAPAPAGARPGGRAGHRVRGRGRARARHAARGRRPRARPAALPARRRARCWSTRSEPRGDGSLRPDLFLWHWRTGRLTRVTRGAGIRAADPLPDGRAAVGVRCLGGSCDLVHIDLAGGTVSVLQPGSPSASGTGRASRRTAPTPSPRCTSRASGG